MGKFLFLILLGLTGWYCYTNGMVYSFTHNLEPEPGRKCELCGPIGEGVYIAPESEDMRFPIDAQIGNSLEKQESRMSLAAAMKQGKVFQIPDHSQVSVLSTGHVSVYKFPYPLTEVSITDGESAGATGWVQREDVIDTPLQQLFQSMRGVKRKETN